VAWRPGYPRGPAVTPTRLLRLHLGCGSTVAPGWVNIDKSPNVYLARAPRLRKALWRAGVLTRTQASADFPEGVVRMDVTRGLPYPDGSAEFVYTSDMIEQLPRWRALELCRECRRVLAPGGAARVVTPDLAAMVRAYDEGEISSWPTPADAFMARLGAYREEPGTLAQRLARRLAHQAAQWAYDERSLDHLLREGGFSEVTFWPPGEGTVPDLARLEVRSEGHIFAEAR
jgi:SAM-dependent methyltransferase